MATSRADEDVWRERLALASIQQQPTELQPWAEHIVLEHPAWAAFRGDVIGWLASEGRGSEALAIVQPLVDIEDARRLMLEAVELLQAGRAMEALPLMESYVEQVPADVLARASLARLLLALGNAELAQVHMQRAVNERDTLPPAQQAALAEELRAYNEMQ
jgi:predicted Zn-dependent protease